MPLFELGFPTNHSIVGWKKKKKTDNNRPNIKRKSTCEKCGVRSSRTWHIHLRIGLTNFAYEWWNSERRCIIIMILWMAMRLSSIFLEQWHKMHPLLWCSDWLRLASKVRMMSADRPVGGRGLTVIYSLLLLIHSISGKVNVILRMFGRLEAAINVTSHQNTCLFSFLRISIVFSHVVGTVTKAKSQSSWEQGVAKCCPHRSDGERVLMKFENLIHNGVLMKSIWYPQTRMITMINAPAVPPTGNRIHDQ